MFIQCPSCRTKFSVDRSLLAEVTSARFHCSRCDHFFEHSPGAEALETEFEVSSDTRAAFASGDSSGQATAGQNFEQLSLLDESGRVSEEDLEQPRAGNDLLVSGDKMPSVKASWPQGSGKQEYSADLKQHVGEAHIWRRTRIQNGAPSSDETILDGKAIDEAFESKINALLPDLEPTIEDRKSSSDATSNVWPNKPAVQIERSAEILKPDAERPAPNTGDTYTFRTSQFLNEAAKPLPDRPLRGVDVRFSDEEEAAEMVRENSSKTRTSSNWGAKAIFSSLMLLPIIVTALLIQWSIHIDQSPSLIKTLFALNNDSLPRVAPPTVNISELSSRYVTLESGKHVLEVQGVITNNSSDQFVDVTLQAKVYDKGNRAIANRVVSANNGLVGASSLSALDINAIERLQQESALAPKLLQTNSPTPFRVVFTEPLDQAAWYGARVYSVKKTL